MSRHIVTLLLFTLMTTAFASEKTKKVQKKQCRKGYERISCEGIKDAKRASFCHKGKIKPEKKEKICKLNKKLKKRKAIKKKVKK